MMEEYDEEEERRLDAEAMALGCKGCFWILAIMGGISILGVIYAIYTLL
jgi:hypothetical protein